ncbi:MAG: hypothetical protein ABI700_32480, partial [Chloroflexota bacterium]
MLATLLALAVGITPLSAQQAELQPIQTGQNAIGELTVENGAASYFLTVSGGETVALQVFALSPGFAPRLRVLNSADVEILVLANPASLISLSASVSFPDAGGYTIEVTGENGTLGQFLLSLQPGVPLPEPTALLLDQSLSHTVGTATPVRIYRFSALTEASLPLTLLTESPDASVRLRLSDEATDRTIA